MKAYCQLRQRDCRRILKNYKVKKSNMDLIVRQYQPPSTKERTKNATIGDRHLIPHPYLDLGRWYKTLFSKRIIDLFRTQDGFYGHAIQINQELIRLSTAINEGAFRHPQCLQTALDYEQSIKNKIIELSQVAPFDFEKFIFNLSGFRTFSIEKVNGVLNLA